MVNSSVPQSLARAPSVDVSHVRGNVNQNAKELCAKVFNHFVSTPDRSYGAEIGRRLRLVEVNVHDQDGGDAPTGETVFEIKVERGKSIPKIISRFRK
jgi:acyl-coenzyme A thioesterase 13